MDSPPAYLSVVYVLVAEGRVSAAMDEIFGRLDDLFLDGNFADADRLLQVIDLEQLDTNLLVGLMCISCPARKQLPSYDALLLRVRARLGQLAPNRVEALMKGFN